MKIEKLPVSYEVGGQKIEVRSVERCDGNAAGICNVFCGYIEIAEKAGKDGHQSFDGKLNTFCHEMTHSILTTMGEYDLNSNETFVCCFAGFLSEILKTMEFGDAVRDVTGKLAREVK